MDFPNDQSLPRTAYLEAGGSLLFGQFQAPSGERASDVAVLICSPWGPDEVASYRPRRAWSERLALAGHPVLRFDLPAVGNSSGDPADPGLAATWVDAVAAAAAWMRANSGAPRTAVLGLGLGGLLAREALAAGAEIDELALWAVPKSGRAFVREMKNFASLQGWGVDDGESSALPEGWLEADGLVLSAETILALEAMDPSRAPGNGVKRALLISRNHGQPPMAVAAQLEQQGAEVEVDPGGRWGAFVSHPETARLPLEISEALQRWLTAAESSETASAATVPELPAAEAEIEVNGSPIKERALTFATSSGTVFGILAEPVASSEAEACAVFLNAGAVRDIGPNRMWTEQARAWAARGVPSVRLDAVGIGDGGGDPNGIEPGDSHFSGDFEVQLETVLDALGEEGMGTRFLLVGLCSGAYHAYRTAVADQRVAAAVLINPSVVIWRPGIFSERELRKNVGWLVEGRRLRKFLHGEIGPTRIAEYVASTARAGHKSLARRFNRGGGLDPHDWPGQFEAELDSLHRRGTRLTIGFSSEQGLADELERTGFVPKLGALPNVTWATLPTNDHTLRPIAAQQALRELLDAQLNTIVAQGAVR